MNWRGRLRARIAAIVSLIGSTISTNGLRVGAELDTRRNAAGVGVTDEQMAQIRWKPHEFHGDWNDTIRPRRLQPK